VEAAAKERELSGEKAQRIVDAMRESVAKRGAAGSTFEHVASEAGVSRGLLHYYFGTKERLLVEVVRRDTEIRLTRLDEPLAKAKTADAVLDVLVASLTGLIEHEPDFFLLLYELFSAGRRNPEIQREVGQLFERTRSHVADVLRAKVAVASAESAKVTAGNRLEIARRRLALAMGEPGAPPVDVTGPPPEFPDPVPSGGSGTGTNERADLRASSLRIANAVRHVRLRQSEYLPDVGFAAAYQVDAEDSPLSPDNRSWRVGVGLTWNLFDGMRREAELGKAAAERRRAQAYHRGMRDQAAFEAVQADLGVKEATLRGEIARAALASAEEGVRLLKSRYENHLGRMVDLLDAQTALDTARAARIRAENDVRLSRAQRLYASGGLLSFAAESEKNGKEKIR